MVERVKGVSLEKYIQDHVAGPLGITSICFHPLSFPDLRSRIPAVSLRTPDGPVIYTDNPIWPLDIGGDSGGSGAYSSIADIQRILHSLTSNDGKLLNSDMVEELFKPNLHPPVQEGVMKEVQDEKKNNIYGGIPIGTKLTYSMGGMTMLEDLEGRRPKNTVYWGGLLNVFFWMDRDNGLSGIFATQVFPAGDIKCLGLLAEFERKIYELYKESKASK